MPKAEQAGTILLDGAAIAEAKIEVHQENGLWKWVALQGALMAPHAVVDEEEYVLTPRGTPPVPLDQITDAKKIEFGLRQGRERLESNVAGRFPGANVKWQQVVLH